MQSCSRIRTNIDSTSVKRCSRRRGDLLTCDDVEALLSLDEGHVVGDEGRVGVGLHAGVTSLQQLHPPDAVGQEAGPHVRHGGGDRGHGKADHGVQLGDDITQRLEGVHVAWRSEVNT